MLAMRRFYPSPTLKIDQLTGIFSFFSLRLIKAGIMPLWYGLLTIEDFSPKRQLLVWSR